MDKSYLFHKKERKKRPFLKTGKNLQNKRRNIHLYTYKEKRVNETFRLEHA